MYENINAETFKKIKKEQPNAVILDVRTKNEFNEGFIEGAIQVDYMSPEFTTAINELDRDKHYLVYCRSGKRSAGACEVMAKMDFDHLYNLVGGYLKWN